jgi:hypothetical protein
LRCQLTPLSLLRNRPPRVAAYNTDGTDGLTNKRYTEPP